MAGTRRRSNKKKGVQRRRKSGYTKRKSTKKTYRKRGSRKSKAKRTKRSTKRRSRTSKGPSIAEMAFVVANHHPAPEAAANAQAVQQAVASISQVSDNQMLPMSF
jgi:4-hydroxyphenylpyruvate dioxygenase-like putative hemolysin